MLDEGAQSQSLNPQSWSERTQSWLNEPCTGQHLESRDQTSSRSSQTGCQRCTSILFYVVFVTSSFAQKSEMLHCKACSANHRRPRLIFVPNVFISNAFQPTFTSGGGGGGAKAAEQLRTSLFDFFFRSFPFCIVRRQHIYHAETACVQLCVLVSLDWPSCVWVGVSVFKACINPSLTSEFYSSQTQQSDAAFPAFSFFFNDRC